MDARQMKVEIMYEAMSQLESADQDHIMSMIYDKVKFTQAEINRFEKVFQEMNQKAEARWRKYH